MKRKFVDELRWIDEEEMLDLTALAQSSPGAIAVNAAILVGWRVAGFWGMVTAVAGSERFCHGRKNDTSKYLLHFCNIHDDLWNGLFPGHVIEPLLLLGSCQQGVPCGRII